MGAPRQLLQALYAWCCQLVALKKVLLSPTFGRSQPCHCIRLWCPSRHKASLPCEPLTAALLLGGCATAAQQALYAMSAAVTRGTRPKLVASADPILMASSIELVARANVLYSQRQSNFIGAGVPSKDRLYSQRRKCWLPMRLAPNVGDGRSHRRSATAGLRVC